MSGEKLTRAQSGDDEWYDHWRHRPGRRRTRDWRDCAYCANKNVYRGMGVTVCAFNQQPADCNRYRYEFHPWLRADGNLWAFDPKPENTTTEDSPSPPAEPLSKPSGKRRKRSE